MSMSLKFALALAVFLAPAIASAAPPAPALAPSSDIHLAANGCGYGFHRAPNGRCDNVRAPNADCQRGFHSVPSPSTASGFRCVQDGY
jgi:hypothetical protein